MQATTSAKQGDSSAMKSRINCPFTVSFGRNRQMLLASSRRCVIALGWSLHSCPSMPLRQTVHTPPTSCFFAPRLKDPTQPFRSGEYDQTTPTSYRPSPFAPNCFQAAHRDGLRKRQSVNPALLANFSLWEDQHTSPEPLARFPDSPALSIPG